MAVNQVIVGDEVKLDLTGDTVSENTLLEGVTAHNAAGEPITGAVAVAPIDSELSETSENPVQNKVITKALNEKANKNVATVESDGLMSAADKVKLNGISGETTSNPNIAVHETLLASFSGSAEVELEDSLENYDWVLINGFYQQSTAFYAKPQLFPTTLLPTFYNRIFSFNDYAHVKIISANKVYFNYASEISIYGLKLKSQGG